MEIPVDKMCGSCKYFDLPPKCKLDDEPTEVTFGCSYHTPEGEGVNEMDEVQRFIANNQHQFGYIMQEASRQWVAKDPIGALTVGDCHSVVQKHGQYHKLIEKLERIEQAWRNGSLDDLDETLRKTFYG